MRETLASGGGPLNGFDSDGTPKEIHIFLEEGVWGSKNEGIKLEGEIAEELEYIEEPAENIDPHADPTLRIGRGQTSSYRYIGSTTYHEKFLETVEKKFDELGYDPSDLTYSRG